MSGVAHFFMVVGGSNIHERLAHFFIDIYINHKYIHMCLKNKFLKGEFSYKSTQTTNIANISTKDLAETIIYLPPLAEQERIVNAVETLFAQIDKIAEQIS